MSTADIALPVVAAPSLPVGIPDAPQLIATCWTSAGNAAPLRGDESSPLDLDYRIEAVAEAGWDGFGLVYGDLVKEREARGLPSIARALDTAGIRYRELEFLAQWWTEGSPRRRSDRQRAELIEAAQVLGAANIKISPAVDVPFPDDAVFIRELASLAAEASAAGIRLALEPLPWSNVSDMAAAASLLTKVEDPSLGLCVDIWHVVRGATDFADLASLLPLDRIFVVELNDAKAEPVGSMFEDTINNRLQCGAGDFDVPGFIAAISALGYTGPWGVEIISDDHRALPLPEALRVTRKNVLDCFTAARVRPLASIDHQ